MRRLWPFGVGLVLWQVISAGFGAGEFAYDLQPPPLAMLAATVMIAGWLALGMWAGRHGVRGYVWFAAVTWFVVLALLVWVKLAVSPDGESAGSWQDALIIPILVAGGPLHPLAHFLPLPHPLDRTLVTAGAMLVTSLGSYAVTRALFGRWRVRTVNTARDR